MSQIIPLIDSLVPLVVAIAALVAAVTSMLSLRQAKATHKLVNSELTKWKIAAVDKATAEGYTAGEEAQRRRDK